MSIAITAQVIHDLKDIGKKSISAKDIDKAFSQYYVWQGEYTKEKELIDLLIKPFTIKKIKWDPFVIANMPSICAYRQVMYCRSGFDYFAAYSGTEGKSKSTLAYHIVHDMKSLGIGFDWNKHIFFRGSDPNKLVHAINLEKLSALWLDEAKGFLEKRESMLRSRIDIIKDMTAQRKNMNAVQLCIGDYTELDIYLRQRRLKEVYVLADRGVYVSLFNTAIIGANNDPFGLEAFHTVIQKNPQLVFNYQAQISVLAGLPSCAGVGVFPPIKGEGWNQYIEMKERENRTLELGRTYEKDYTQRKPQTKNLKNFIEGD